MRLTQFVGQQLMLFLDFARSSSLSKMAGSPPLSHNSPGPKPWLDNGSVFQLTAALKAVPPAMSVPNSPEIQFIFMLPASAP